MYGNSIKRRGAEFRESEDSSGPRDAGAVTKVTVPLMRYSAAMAHGPACIRVQPSAELPRRRPENPGVGASPCACAVCRVTMHAIDTRRHALGPLEGIRIIELAAIGPVPLCAMLLADLG